MKDITHMFRDNMLTVKELDPKKTYVFTLGNENFVPTQDDLMAFRDMIEILTEGEKYFPAIIISNQMEPKIETKQEYENRMMVVKTNRLDNIK